MKISSKILSIPPYISTAWENVFALHVREDTEKLALIVILKDGSQTIIPNLNKAQITIIFNAHARFLETKDAPKTPSPALPTDPVNIVVPIGGDGNVDIEALPASTKHNPEQADLPPLPKHVLDKLTALAKALGVDKFTALPAAEPDCNCIHCQVMNAMRQAGQEIEEEEHVSEEDLKFREWDIRQTADNLYIVTNPLDAKEYYSVFLGTPLGCTCGRKDCEHIRAVLSS